MRNTKNEKYNKSNISYRIKNREKKRIYNIEYVKKHPNYLKDWIKKHSRYYDKYNKIKNDRLRFGGNRENVLERDNWQCQKCFLTAEQHLLLFSKNISVHHIDGNKQNNSLDNLITLCVRCHRQLHILQENR